MRIVAVLVVMLLSGCASMFQPDAAMSVDQMKALSADKSASAVCSQIIGAWGTARVTSVNLDKSTFKVGGVVIKPDCSVELAANDQPQPKAASEPTALRSGMCSKESYQRGTDGSCVLVQRDAECRASYSRAVAPELCAGLTPP